jgi:hypothetical protein
LLDTIQANEQQEATERAIQYASDEFERLLLLKAQDELEESSFRQEIDVLYEHTCQILTSVLEQENP